MFSADEFYTREVVTSIPQMMDRFARLTLLLANAVPEKRVNRHLREATRCCIYGFQQACVTLCRAAIETSLNDVFAARFHQPFSERIDLIGKIVGDRQKVKIFEHAPTDREVGAGSRVRFRRRRGGRKSSKGSIHALSRKHFTH